VREEGPVRVIEVVAAVELEDDEEKAQRAAVFRGSDTLDAERIELVVQNIADPSRYQMYASLAANLPTGVVSRQECGTSASAAPETASGRSFTATAGRSSVRIPTSISACSTAPTALAFPIWRTRSPATP
jgi:hypothetical protein